MKSLFDCVHCVFSCRWRVKLIMLTPMIAGSKASFADRSIMGVLVSMPQK